MRKPLIAGNWKMYKTPKESLAFLDAFLPMVEGHDRDEIVLFPTMSSLAYAIEHADHRQLNVRAGAQGNMHPGSTKAPTPAQDIAHHARLHRLPPRPARPF